MRIWFLPAIYILFAMISVLTLSSIAPELAPKQFAFFVFGGIIFYLVASLKFETIERLSPLGYALTIFLLILTLVIALQTRNTSRWIDIAGIVRLQPSQLAIPAVGLYAAQWIKSRSMAVWKNLLIALGIIAVPAFLILIEPDLGTTLVFLASIATMIYFSKIRFHQVLTLGAVGAAIVIFSWFFVLQPYQKVRITSFISSGDSSSSQALTTSYNAQQSLIAVGSGQLVGRGPGQGVQSHLRFLPERQTDFIFASLAEEFGFLGSALIISLYFSIFLYLIYVGFQTNSVSSRLFCLMSAAMIAIQAGINIGMNIGILPITGLTLPLLSYGGSSLITIAGMFGIVQSIVKNQEKTLALHLK